MVNFLLFSLAVIGMSHIVVDGAIMQWFRDLVDAYVWGPIAKLFHCNQCCGFWCGLFCGWAAFPCASLFQIFLFGCAGSFLSKFAEFLLNYIETQTIVDLNNLGAK